MSGLLIAAIAAGTVTAVELPDNSGLAGLVRDPVPAELGVRRDGGAFGTHVAPAVTRGSLPGLLPHKIVQIAVDDPVTVGIRSMLALWLVAALAITGGRDYCGSCRCGGSATWPRW